VGGRAELVNVSFLEPGQDTRHLLQDANDDGVRAALAGSLV
jgi:hypothetical protein